MGAGDDKMQYGVRFDFELQPGATEARAEYRVQVRTGEGEGVTVAVEITPSGARIVTGEESVSANSAQLVALAKTLGKRSAEEGWPRRIARWRQPGVR